MEKTKSFIRAKTIVVFGFSCAMLDSHVYSFRYHKFDTEKYRDKRYDSGKEKTISSSKSTATKNVEREKESNEEAKNGIWNGCDVSNVIDYIRIYFLCVCALWRHSNHTTTHTCRHQTICGNRIRQMWIARHSVSSAQNRDFSNNIISIFLYFGTWSSQCFHPMTTLVQRLLLHFTEIHSFTPRNNFTIDFLSLSIDVEIILCEIQIFLLLCPRQSFWIFNFCNLKYSEEKVCRPQFIIRNGIYSSLGWLSP